MRGTARSLGVTLLLLLSSCASTTRSLVMPQGSGHFAFNDPQINPGKPITVWTYKPKGVGPDVPVVFVMHGASRNGDDYRDAWIEYANRYRFVVIAPEFARPYYPKAWGYNLGNMFRDGREEIPESQWAFTAIEAIFDRVVKENQLSAQDYRIYGHSAGAQFVHRMVLFKPDARIKRAVAANAGWYTLPQYDVHFPYGLRGSGFDQHGLARVFSKDLIVLLGTSDNDPYHRSLRRTSEAMAQGSHRFERGQTFFAEAERAAVRNGLRLSWRVEFVPGVGHSNRGMSPAAAELLSGP